MNKNTEDTKAGNISDSEEKNTLKNKPKNRAKKRKREDTESSSDQEDELPENFLEVERSLQASALKNNLDEASVKKILKKVVTNDHVLALVKIREEEESSADEKSLQPKLTRSKVKELRKASPKSGRWNLENLELTPIKHIPVKTRPEVKALIAQELPEDEDDEEYEPTHDDVPSDDDHVLESCSDLDSMPSTPATPGSQTTASPQVVKDGPFKVPQEIVSSTPTRRKLVIDEEEATIALRTRSKLSLSATPIEHIESSFVPPDDLPTPAVDDLWNEFLKECLNPASVTRNEEDDEADPEYNAAADPDAHEEDEEALEKSIFKISKKELNDLMTELFNIMPDATTEELAENLAKNVLAERENEVSNHWDGKQEPPSEDETEHSKLEKRDSTIRFSIGKSEPVDADYENADQSVAKSNKDSQSIDIISVEKAGPVESPSSNQVEPPPLLRRMEKPCDTVHIRIDEPCPLLPKQRLILEQQLRQHIQLATSNYLQLYINPVHWALAPIYKDYLEQFHKMLETNPKSIVNVCNLKPALELMRSWEKSVSEDTPHNKKMVEFIQAQAERSRRRMSQNSLYVGDFHETMMSVVANSSVFLYPFLLPAMPYRPDRNRKASYRSSEEELIALGLEQFWQYVDDNPELFKRPSRFHPRRRWGLATVCELVCKHMFPWLSTNWLLNHIHRIKISKDKDNPLYNFFVKQEVKPVQHKLLPFNPSLTLYEQPEDEMPRIWVRYLAQNSKRFKNHLTRRKNSGLVPTGGVVVDTGALAEPLKKNALPIEFTKKIIATRANLKPKVITEPLIDKFDVKVVNGNIILQGKGEESSRKDKDENVDQTTFSATIMTADDASKTVVTDSNVSQAIKANNDSDNKITRVTTPVSISTSFNTGAKNTSKLNLILVPITNAEVANTVTKTPIKDISEKNTAVSNTDAQNTSVTNADSKIVTRSKTPVTPTTHPNSAVQTISYKLVETSNGAFLLPVNFVQSTSTVNCILEPISSTGEGNKPDNVANSKATNSQSERNKDVNVHCKCCLLLNKICKRQTFITDFFKAKDTANKQCKCNNRKYPKVSKRLKLLVSNFKNRSWSVRSDIEQKLRLNKKPHVDEARRVLMSDDNYDLNDIAYVTSYQHKIILKTNLVRNTYIKKKVYNLLSKFDLSHDNPMVLAERLFKAYDVELIELYKEFLGFLTAEQADCIGKFKDYFIQSCAAGLAKDIEQQVTEKGRLIGMLSHLNAIFVDSVSTSCEMCCSLLSTMDGYPKLAEHVFDLFPHRTVKRFVPQTSIMLPIQPILVDPTIEEATKPTECSAAIEKAADDVDRTITTESHAMGKEADHSVKFKTKSPTVLAIPSSGNPAPAIIKSALNLSGSSAASEEAEDNLTICEKSYNMEYDADHSVIESEADHSVRLEAQTPTVLPPRSSVNPSPAQIQVPKPTESSAANEEADDDGNLTICEESHAMDYDADHSVMECEADDSVRCEGKTPTALPTQSRLNPSPGQIKVPKPTESSAASEEPDDDGNLTICEESHAMDYEADHSVSEDDIAEKSAEKTIVPVKYVAVCERTIKKEDLSYENIQLTIGKTEIYDSESEMSMTIVSEDETIKSETPEWKRDEDKLILELIQHYLMEKDENKTVLEVIEENNLPQLIAGSLTDKSLEEIKERILCLLHLLVDR